MTALAAIRADSVNFPLFLHVLGAMLLVGTLLAVSGAILVGWRRTDPGEVAGLSRLAFWTLLAGVVPSYILMRFAGMWTESEEDIQGDPAWIGIGYVTTEIGLLLILISIILSVIGLRRLRRGGGGFGLGRAVGIFTTLLLAVYVVAIWAMTTKPD